MQVDKDLVDRFMPPDEEHDSYFWFERLNKDSKKKVCHKINTFLAQCIVLTHSPSFVQVVIYEAVEYIHGIQRSLVKAPDDAGRMRLLKSYSWRPKILGRKRRKKCTSPFRSLEGVTHETGDAGAPTYFR